jgi:hypothetical protein
MWDKLRSLIGRKLLSVILTPILTAGLIAVNAMIPEGSRLAPADMTKIVEYIIGLVAAFVVTQGAADVKNGTPGNPSASVIKANADAGNTQPAGPVDMG